ncbi:MAG: transposase [Clostridia bacterium]|nr:transposase [Clostridia bacterium]
MTLAKRKPNRLQNYDYSNSGYYFVTVCTYEKRMLLSQIVGQGLAPAENRLTEYGKIVQEELLALENRYANVRIDQFVVMPNHIHAIVVLQNDSAAGASPCPTLSDVVCVFKSIATRRCRPAGFKGKFFQTSYYDHIIREREDYEKIWEYIEYNPIKWNDDRFYCE